MKSPVPLSLDFRNTNTLWCSVLVGTLVRGGVRHAVVCPGSRSAPLTIALAREPAIEAIPVLDERSAGFFALGLAKQHRRAVALVCTSGTAAANFLPAVVEAYESGVPLLVLTADRPPELRDCRAGQTIEQVGLYRNFVTFEQDLPVPEATMPALRGLRQAIHRALTCTLSPVAGPVHLNCPYRDPLVPLADGKTLPLPAELKNFLTGIDTVTAPTRLRSGPTSTPRWSERGVIVLGPHETDAGASTARQAGQLARALGWPVLADALSSGRTHARLVGPVISHYDAVLREATVAASLRPRQVICLGGWPTSKVLRAWLQAADPEVWFVTESARNEDGLQLRTKFVRGPLAAWSKRFSGRRALADYARAWRQADVKAGRELAAGVRAARGLVEPVWPAILAQHLPTGTGVFIASSMPVRDAEYFWPAGNGRQRIRCNRGANGIDGTLSTALGVFHGGAPAVLVTGDLALLHDTNGFLTVPKFQGSLTILLINNNGGGIFEHLPVAGFEPPFEQYFATPQDIPFAKLAATYGVSHTRVTSGAQLARLMARLPVSGVRILELRTERKRDAVFRRTLFARLAG